MVPQKQQSQQFNSVPVSVFDPSDLLTPEQLAHRLRVEKTRHHHDSHNPVKFKDFNRRAIFGTSLE